MASKAQHLRVGMFTAAALGLLAIVLIVFGGLRFWESSDHYRVVFDGSVIGLQPGAEVYMNGIKIGTVDAIAVAPGDLRKVSVTIEVKRGTPIHADTEAVLQYAGITGLKVIDLRGGTLASPALPPGGQIPAGAGMLDKLQQQAEALADQTNELMKRAGDVMQRASTLTDQLIAMTEPAKRGAANFEAMSASLAAMVDENRAGLRQSLAAFRRTADGASNLIDTQAAQLFGDAGDVVGEFKKLLTVNEGPLRAAVFDLRQASRSFKELARDVRQKPSRLLFASEPSERKLP